MPVCSMISRPTTVFVSWNAGRQCMNFALRLPVASSSARFTWYGVRSRTRSSHTSLASPIDTQTSVWTKSTPDTAACASSVIVISAPVRVGDVAGDLDDVRRWLELGRAREPDVGSHQRAHHEQRSAHVEPTVTDERVREPVVRLVGRLVHREEVGEHLRRVPLGGEAVVHGNAGELRQLLDLGLGAPRNSMPSYIRPSTRAVSAIDSLWPSCEPDGIEVGDVRALVVGRDLERRAGPGRRLLEDQRDLLAARGAGPRCRRTWRSSAPRRAAAGSAAPAARSRSP